jgi:ubiquinone/menaquinone biosynthesis C-methylase UbiE
MMSLIHEDLYRVFRDPYEVLRAAGLASGQDVLEVGCGPGFFTVAAARIVGEQGSVCALDINPLALERVRQKVEKEGVTNVCTTLADAGQTGLPGESFDLIFVFGLGRVVGGADRMVAELHRLLRPEGILSIEGRVTPSGGPFQCVKREGRIRQYRKTV